MAKQQIRTERHGESEGELRVGEGLRESKMAKQQIRTERHGERERERERERKGGVILLIANAKLFPDSEGEFSVRPYPRIPESYIHLN